MELFRSMTGFGQAGRYNGDLRIQIEIKSVNHRYLETIVRMPREWNQFEDAVKSKIQHRVKRGRIDVSIVIERQSAANHLWMIDWQLAESYIRASEQLKARFGFADELTLKDLIGIPGLIQLQNSIMPDDAESNESELLDCLSEALANLMKMRVTEGNSLHSDLYFRITTLDNLLEGLILSAPAAVIEYRNKLRAKIHDLLSDAVSLDEHRLAMEVAIFAERSNVDEELIRLQSHIKQFRQMLEEQEPIGRKLDFLIQEMNREVNTVGSKANHVQLSNIVVEMKAELEKIREQVQNVE